MKKFSNAEKAQELRREIGMRRHVYPKKVADGKMTPQACDRLIALAEAMLADYEALAAADTPDMFAPAPPRAPPMREITEGGRVPPPPASANQAIQERQEGRVGSDPTFGKTPGRLIESGAKWGTCKCGSKILTGLVRDVMDSTLNTRIWDATPLTLNNQNYYTRHRCNG